MLVAPKLEYPESLEGIEGAKVALVVAPGDWPIDPDVAANTRAAAEAFREAGAIVEEVRARRDAGEDVCRATYTTSVPIFGADIMAEAEAHARPVMTPYAVKMAEDSARCCRAGPSFAEAWPSRRASWTAVADVLAEHELLLLPHRRRPVASSPATTTSTTG